MKLFKKRKQIVTHTHVVINANNITSYIIERVILHYTKYPIIGEYLNYMEKDYHYINDIFGNNIEAAKRHNSLESVKEETIKICNNFKEKYILKSSILE